MPHTQAEWCGCGFSLELGAGGWGLGTGLGVVCKFVWRMCKRKVRAYSSIKIKAAVARVPVMEITTERARAKV